MQNEYFYKILWYFNKLKSENRGLKHITLLFLKCNCLISTEMRYKPCFNGYNGINRSHETLREVIPWCNEILTLLISQKQSYFAKLAKRTLKYCKLQEAI